MDNEKPAIAYPCQWDYRIIGRSSAAIRAVVQEVVFDAAYRLEDSHVSSGGKYCSMALAVDVRDQAQRDRIFMALRNHRDVILVL